MQKDYSKFSAEDFILEKSFQSYYLGSDETNIFFWKKWIIQHPDKEDEIKEALVLLNMIYTKLPEEEMMVETNHFSQKMKSDWLQSVSERWLLVSSRMAAVITLILIAGLAGYFLAIDSDQGEELAEMSEVSMITKSTSKGQKTTITLKDGSRIKLNAESSITFPQHFEDSVRMIYLEGEAYFEVAPNPELPFVVQCEGFYAKVLGTSFNVNAYAEKESADVVLAEGKVEVYQKNKLGNIVLQPHEMASFDKQSLMLKKSVVDISAYTVWKDGVILFKEASFAEIENVLERWYDIDFQYSKAPRMKGFSGEFKNQSLESVLDGISFAVGFDYIIEGKNIKIKP